MTGGDVALDGITGVSLDPTDLAIVADHTGNTIYYYEVRLDSAAENSPYVIDPDDAGVTRWHLMDMYGGVISVASGLYVEGTRWDDGSGNIDGEQVADDTIDDDSLDFVDITLDDFADSGTSKTINSSPSGNSDYIVGSDGENWYGINPESMPEVIGLVIGTNVQAYDANILSGDTEAGTPTGTWDFTGGTITFTATDMETDLEAVLDIDALQSGASDIFDKTGDAALMTNWDTAYGWGDHGAVGYLSGDTEAGVPTGTWDFTGGTIDFNISDVTGLLSGDTESGAPTGTYSFTGELSATTPTLSLLDLPEVVVVPDTPDTNKLRLYTEAIKGFSFLKYFDDGGMKRAFLRDSIIIVRNERGSSIAANRIVYASGSTTEVPLVELAKADSISTLPAIGITIESIADDAYGRVMQVGLLENVNTAALAEGDVLYVSDSTAGVPVTTAPISPSLTQEIGTVLVSDAADGAIQIVARGLTGDEYGTAQDSFRFGSGVNPHTTVDSANGVSTFQLQFNDGTIQITAATGSSAYAVDGGLITGVSTFAFAQDDSGTSPTVASDGRGGVTVYGNFSGTAAGAVDTSGVPVDDDYAKFTDANTIEGRSYSEMATDLEAALENVLDIDDLQSGVSDIFDKTGDAALIATFLTASPFGADINLAELNADVVHSGIPSGVSDIMDKTGDAALIAGFYDNTDTQLTQEQVEDFAGGMDDGTETRISVTYQDGAGNIDYVVDDMNDDVPEAGDFGNAYELDANGAIDYDGANTGTTTSAVSAVVIQANIFNPDDVQSGVSENICIFVVDGDKWPNGLLIDTIYGDQFGVTEYTLDIEEWTAGVTASKSSDIEAAFKIGAGRSSVLGASIDDRDVAAWSRIFLDLPTTETDQLFIWMRGMVK